MLKLFAVVLGGRADGCNIELHDVVFVVGHSLRDTYSALIDKWFGNKQRLHIDATIELKYVDSHEIAITMDKPKENKKIYYVNFGGYKPHYFGEVHESKFYVGSSKSEVLARAKKELCLALTEPHCDDNLIIDDMLSVDRVDHYYIHLRASENTSELKIESVYRKLNSSVMDKKNKS